MTKTKLNHNQLSAKRSTLVKQKIRRCAKKNHSKLTNDDTRDKTLSGSSNIEDFVEENVHEFLCLSKRRATTKNFNAKEVTEEEFRKLVKQSKRRSKSSMFSKRDCSVNECAMSCDRIVKTLVRFCNTIAKHNHFPSRWLDSLDAMIEN